MKIVSNPRPCSTFIHVADDPRSWVIHLYSPGRFSPWCYLPLNCSFSLILVCRCRCGRGSVNHHSRSSVHMLSRGHLTTIFVVSMFMLFLLKDLLTKFIITCTLKDKLTTWLCLVEGYLSSLHNLVSFRIEHTICSRVRCITKENTIDRRSLKLVQLLAFLKNETLATKDMEVTHLGCATVHQLIACFLLMHSKVDPARHIARGIHRLSPEPSRSPMLSSIVRAISHKVLFFLSTTPFSGGVYGLEN
jgi:hypothetical protein